jgi:hypothetical protein
MGAVVRQLEANLCTVRFGFKHGRTKQHVFMNVNTSCAFKSVSSAAFLLNSYADPDNWTKRVQTTFFLRTPSGYHVFPLYHESAISRTCFPWYDTMSTETSNGNVQDLFRRYAIRILEATSAILRFTSVFTQS